ncbi:hypothetical protein PMAYCL1PPCAC_06464, partial [Pristionchus mayeri]
EEEEEEEENEDKDPTQEEEGLSDGDATLEEEINDSEEDKEWAAGNNELNRSVVGDVSMLDVTLPLHDVVASITNEDLRRLLAACGQKDFGDMMEFTSDISTAEKVGEGGYAEVFRITKRWKKEAKKEATIFKILAIENDEYAGEFFPEVIISKELTRLQKDHITTSAFAKLHQVKVVRGLFPRLLSDAWVFFRENDDEAENEENPLALGDQQLFLILECEFGGHNLTKFPFSSVMEVVSVYCQTALALAVAESKCQFEHRDLHEQNVLVKRTDDEWIEFNYDLPKKNGGRVGNHKSIRVASHGVKTTIIDFTLSRLTREKKTVEHEPEIMNIDIGDEVCDQSRKDEQFQVYKKMKKLTKGKWEQYTPRTNVLWLRMIINWIIKNNLDSNSDVNKKRLGNSKDARNSRKNTFSKKVSRRQSKRKFTECTSAEEGRKEMSGETWIKKIKEGKSLIDALKSFARGIDKFVSALDLVSSDSFEKLRLLLLE